jgi:uncharacterized protein (DUF983 family)
MSEPRSPEPVIAGLRSRCPRCGQGKLFQAYLKLAPRCAVCGADFSHADSGDGPAVFVMFVVGAVVVPLAFILQFGLELPSWATITISFIATLALSLALLPPFKGALFALQWKHKAGEARLTEADPEIDREERR